LPTPNSSRPGKQPGWRSSPIAIIPKFEKLMNWLAVGLLTKANFVNLVTYSSVASGHPQCYYQETRWVSAYLHYIPNTKTWRCSFKAGPVPKYTVNDPKRLSSLKKNGTRSTEEGNKTKATREESTPVSITYWYYCTHACQHAQGLAKTYASTH
jgi:hypothetical protein